MLRSGLVPVTPEPWTALPEPLQEPARTAFEAYREAAGRAGCRVPDSQELRRSLCRLFACSEFAAGLCRRRPALVEGLLESGDLLADYRPDLFLAAVRDRVEGARDEADLRRRLRRLRQREMLRIAWRDLAGWAPLGETLGDLSVLAEGCVAGALERLSAWQAAELPAPVIRKGRPAGLLVLAMGKLGARELNFSSDIDLIFAYPDARPARRGAPDPEDYFTRLGQRLIQAISEADDDGFVFRVDMRLRPYGESGALVCSFSALEEYYQTQGREWERYAMVKARPVAGDPGAGEALIELLRPFVYRRYLDYGAFEALRDLKRQIQHQVERKGHRDNLKLGPGGIREIEFIVQAFQLVRGGREPRLRERGLLRVLDTLGELELLPDYVVDELSEAYVFLRRVENRLQALRDQQVHRLPADEPDRTRLATAMGYAGWSSFHRALERHRRRVQSHFERVFAAPQAAPETAGTPLQRLWEGSLEGDEALSVLRSAGYDDAGEALRWVEQLRAGGIQRALGEQGRARLDALAPLVIAAAARQPNGAGVLARLVRILEHIAGRTTYLSLLLENPMALSQLARLCSASAWIAGQLARHPMLLDQLLDPRSLYAPPAPQELAAELDRQLQDVAAGDLEQQMDRLRHFRHAMTLRVAAADIAGALPVDEVSRRLTAIAETVLERVLAFAWADMTSRHGKPTCTVRGRRRPVRFAIVGYGKLGGRELGYGSDLDLVFLHDSAGRDQHTSGRRRVDNQVFFARLGQRIIHMLDTLTPAGVLYEVDARLRPSGNSGPLVSSLEAFADYQRREAWTWEHQALVRARVVTGNAEVRRRFQHIRAQILQRPRDPRRLCAEVREMRERMRRELGSARSGRFHLKHDRGGIVDIEFMVQYQVLRWSHDHPELVRCTDTAGLLEALAQAGLLRQGDAARLAEAYRAYRTLSHRLALSGESPLLDDGDALSGHRRAVAELWQNMMEE